MKALKNIKVIKSPSKIAGFAEDGYTSNGTKRLVSKDGCVLYIPNFQTGAKYFEENHVAEVIEIFSKRKVA
jgi:hypothetical protein